MRGCRVRVYGLRVRTRGASMCGRANLACELSAAARYFRAEMRDPMCGYGVILRADILLSDMRISRSDVGIWWAIFVTIHV